jgi:Fe-Mn family superoxide dismutase
MAFELPDLPYQYDALEPYMSSRTLHLHHDKHHQTYVTNLNNLIEDTDLKNASLEEIVAASAKDPAKAGVFNNAGQAWNHNLFWRIMKKGGGGTPGGELGRRIDDAFGGFEGFKEQFKTAAVTEVSAAGLWAVAQEARSVMVRTMPVKEVASRIQPL